MVCAHTLVNGQLLLLQRVMQTSKTNVRLSVDDTTLTAHSSLTPPHSHSGLRAPLFPAFQPHRHAKSG
jgi:hypothetical protein